MGVYRSVQLAAMKASEFRRWLSTMNLSDGAAAGALGISRTTLAGYKKTGAPLQTWLACTCYANGLRLWGSTPAADSRAPRQ